MLLGEFNPDVGSGEGVVPVNVGVSHEEERTGTVWVCVGVSSSITISYSGLIGMDRVKNMQIQIYGQNNTFGRGLPG